MKRILIFVLFFALIINTFADRIIYINPMHITSISIHENKNVQLLDVRVNTINGSHVITFTSNEIENIDKFKTIMDNAIWKDSVKQIMIDYYKDQLLIQTHTSLVIVKDKNKQTKSIYSLYNN